MSQNSNGSQPSSIPRTLSGMTLDELVEVKRSFQILAGAVDYVQGIDENLDRSLSGAMGRVNLLQTDVNYFIKTRYEEKKENNGEQPA